MMHATDLLNRLVDYIRPLESAVVAFSGGVDSTLVLLLAVRALGAGNVLALTADSDTLPARERQEAVDLARQIGVSHTLVATEEMKNEDFSANPPERCFHCKTELWRHGRQLAGQRGLKHLLDGVNADDEGDFRPGIEASDAAGALHPLAACGVGKEGVRLLARELGLPNWDKPSQACLSSRFPYGQQITPAGLRRVDQAEELLRGMGFRALRVRDHGAIARIEVPLDEIALLSGGERRAEVVDGLRELGYTYVTIDLEGFRSGSMNEAL
ncbi:MAG: ATP-dependent sacrificial sulfur transferase LarE [Gaiellales bacterium]|nr:MAG: ATP-dependent sacrificial sulfur transferase LarE [Gaiellales bacterium]